MNKVETIELLKVLVGAYPNTKINNVEGLVNSWLMTFAEDPAEDVYKACRWHIECNQWFPKPSEIKKKLGLAHHMYKASDNPAIEAGEVGYDWDTGCDVCPYAELGCRKEVCIV